MIMIHSSMYKYAIKVFFIILMPKNVICLKN